MKPLHGKVAFITGAARGQGRSHAVRLAEEGADIIAVDVCAQIPSVHYPLATAADLEETRTLVEKLDRRIVAMAADVRRPEQLQDAVNAGVAEFGRVDIVLANAGIAPIQGPGGNENLELWRDVVDVNLTGVWNTVQAAIPTMKSAGQGGSIVITSSAAGLKGSIVYGTAGGTAYTTTKHGVVGMMRALATELAPHSIRVNTVHPTGVDTPMLNNDYMTQFLEPERETKGNLMNALPVEVLQPVDISNAILWLVSDAACYVTGVALPVDAGVTIL
jgi:SDR family mycofactocin-dependent oxidoreductase